MPHIFIDLKCKCEYVRNKIVTGQCPTRKPRCTRCTLQARYAKGSKCPPGTHCSCCDRACRKSRLKV